MPVMSGFIIFRSGLPYDANFEFIENPAYQYSDCIWFNEKFECPYIYKTAEQGFQDFGKVVFEFKKIFQKWIMSGVTVTMFIIVVYHLIMLMDVVKQSGCIKVLKPYLVSGLRKHVFVLLNFVIIFEKSTSIL